MKDDGKKIGKSKERQSSGTGECFFVMDSIMSMIQGDKALVYR